MSELKIRTLVVGGSGFIGQALLASLCADSERELTVLGRSAHPRHQLPTGVHYIQGDAGNHNLITKLMQETDELVDLAYATVPQTSFIDPLFDVVANLPTAVRLLQIASKARLRRYVLVSSGGTVYGETTAARIRETDPTNPVSPYGISKLVAEKYALFFHQMEQLPVVIARPGNPYGSLQIGQTVQGFIGASIAAIRSGRPVTVFGSRGAVRDYLHVDDLGDGIASILRHGHPGSIYNLGTGIGHDNLEVLQILQGFADMDGLTIEVRNEAERPFDVKRNVLDSTLALEHVGWQAQTALNVGLKRVWVASRADF